MAVTAEAGHGQRPLVAISSCLLGERVRYDGGDKRDPFITETLARQFRWLPLCPETAIGLGVPRAPIQLVDIDGLTHALGVRRPELDPTRALLAFAHQQLELLAGVDGWICKSRSPSCGLSDTPVYDQRGDRLRSGSGLFTAVIRECLGQLPLIDERQLADPGLREQFLYRVQQRWRARRVGEEGQ
ncbi:MAG TPA: DUF523 domain-containing protein [Gammaproteobacteria bacterium]|nr:DUF523 domain-containing protein [Gammaproteobacteria bacterium]